LWILAYAKSFKYVKRKYLEGTVSKHEIKGNKTIKTIGQLNPDWVEWLMGWPIRWTSLDPIDELIWLDWSVDPADVESDEAWATPKASIDGTSVKTLQMVKNGVAENSLMRQVLMKGKNIGIIPRVSTNIPNRVNRLKAIGNGQVPQCTAMAFAISMQGIRFTRNVR